LIILFCRLIILFCRLIILFCRLLPQTWNIIQFNIL